ncbi:helicase-related protein [uncultured Vagococcus sp.]|uniref:helicase-related protein n=1 Tax=uncultured Vagococcus sp. TaxID=189676 RepID=UPI0028D57879|nr:helicase-related protein [uncultured Vagococcus sp.]
MLSTSELLSTREELIKQLKEEIIGPGSERDITDREREVITSSPEQRYSAGVLFPQDNIIAAENDEIFDASIEGKLALDEIEESLTADMNMEQGVGKKEITRRSNMDFDSEENLDDEVGLSNQNLPSSMGISFFITSPEKIINIDLHFATYVKAKMEDCRVIFNPENPENYKVPKCIESIVYFDEKDNCIKCIKQFTSKDISYLKQQGQIATDEYDLLHCLYKLANQIKRSYKRIPHIEAVKLDFTKENYIDNNGVESTVKAKVTALRREVQPDLFSLTIMLVNEEIGKPNGENCIFQSKIIVNSKNNNFQFAERSSYLKFEELSEDELSLAMLYRDKKKYGSGLGTSLNWCIDENGEGKVESEFVPEIEVPNMDFELPKEAQLDKKSLSMKYLSDLNSESKENKIGILKKFIDSYSNWIIDLEKTLPSLPKNFQNVGDKNIKNCRLSYIRMSDGLDILRENEDAWYSFELANRAMHMQRYQLEFQKKHSDKDRYPDDKELTNSLNLINYIDGVDEFYWRPFQLAFILMSIRSITEDDCKERELVDLIWFPTGGGKTEAYLGLTAFTIFYRRLAHFDQSNGSTVIMRYTLRLLASQQFTRAATLICACELIRMETKNRKTNFRKYRLGEESVSIGLWIGSQHIPNTNQKAKEELDKLCDKSKGDLYTRIEWHNKFHILKCPWCGTKMTKGIKENIEVGQWGYKMRQGKNFYLSCPQEACSFNQKLPIQIIDEELYKNPPTLLFGTVDKFAMLPWESKVGNFFASHNNNRCPELIIQDELHLISGPLGTMVGLYETAIEAICRKKSNIFKIVASTATISRAKEQCASLYNREVTQFPAPGLNSSDSFFAKESVISYDKNNFGRVYLGVLPSGKTKAMMEVRMLSTLLQNVKTLEVDDKVIDKFWTLTVYFNSLRDLGKASTLLGDDVRDFIRRIASRNNNLDRLRLLGTPDELTSRISTTQLTTTLDKLEKVQYSKKNIDNKIYASNVLLATNMISVGIDVARLNMMLLVGQPKLTSEYIQATSRVGREYPGVVFVQYDGTKSRDRSHYEQFKSYHESFYQFVEPTGVTPFSKPARERALHAVVVSILRQISEKLEGEEDAQNFDKKEFLNEILGIQNFIVTRDKEIMGRLNDHLVPSSEEIIEEIQNFINDWSNLLEEKDSSTLHYGKKYMMKKTSSDQRRLLKTFNSNRSDLNARDTMTSLRNVDSMVASNILIWKER